MLQVNCEQALQAVKGARKASRTNVTVLMSREDQEQLCKALRNSPWVFEIYSSSEGDLVMVDCFYNYENFMIAQEYSE